MGALKKGIPDDTPENTVRFIEEILEEEAATLNVHIERTEEQAGFIRRLEMRVNQASPNKSFYVFLEYARSQDMRLAPTDGK